MNAILRRMIYGTTSPGNVIVRNKDSFSSLASRMAEAEQTMLSGAECEKRNPTAKDDQKPSSK